MSAQQDDPFSNDEQPIAKLEFLLIYGSMVVISPPLTGLSAVILFFLFGSQGLLDRLVSSQSLDGVWVVALSVIFIFAMISSLVLTLAVWLFAKKALPLLKAVGIVIIAGLGAGVFIQFKPLFVLMHVLLTYFLLRWTVR